MRTPSRRSTGRPRPPTSWAVYPPVLYELIVPAAYLPWAIAEVIGLLGLAVLPFLALRVMGVRDWRCYAVAYSSVPVYTSVLLGTISGALMLGVAPCGVAGTSCPQAGRRSPQSCSCGRCSWSSSGAIGAEACPHACGGARHDPMGAALGPRTSPPPRDALGPLGRRGPRQLLGDGTRLCARRPAASGNRHWDRARAGPHGSGGARSTGGSRDAAYTSPSSRHCRISDRLDALPDAALPALPRATRGSTGSGSWRSCRGPARTGARTGTSGPSSRPALLRRDRPATLFPTIFTRRRVIRAPRPGVRH